KNTSYSVLMQGPRSKFVRNVEDDRAVFMTKPDISIMFDNTVVKIADTKYKKLTEDDAKYGVSQADLYQMFAYSRKYKTKDITLIYPKTNHVQIHTLELPDETTVNIRSVDLRRDIRRDIAAIEQEIVEMFTSQDTETISLRIQ